MDTFFEQIVVRKSRLIEKIIRVLMVVFGALAILFMLYISFFRVFGVLSSLMLPAAFALAIGLYFIIKSTYIEYEYSITNDSFDIDRIIGKRKRQRMLTTACSSFEEFGVYNGSEERLKQRDFDAKVLAANLNEDGLYYAVISHRRLGRVLMVIQPDERIKSALKKFIPRQVQGDVFSGN